MRPLVIGTRGSKLALTQARWVMDEIRSVCPGLEVREKIIRTRGDRVQDVPLAGMGEKGMFVRELEAALASGEIDAAVHSLKDLPSSLAPEFCLAAVPEGEDPRDCLIAPGCGSLQALQRGAIVGTGSPRRRAQLLALRPDLQVRDIRGNVDTRLRKVRDGEYHALVLAVAGLKRLGLDDAVSQVFEIDEMMPAIGQGTLAIEARAGDARVLENVRRVNDPSAMTEIVAERSLAEALGAGCAVPLGAHAQILDDVPLVSLSMVLCDAAGERLIRKRIEGDLEWPRELGIAAAKVLLDAGGEELLAPYR